MSTFSAHIISGHGRGKGLGFPTLNLKVDASSGSGEHPAEGVYAVRVRLDPLAPFSQDEWLSGVMHVGPRPTFHEQDVSMEVHLLDLKGDIVAQNVEVAVVGRLREVRSFDSPEALKKQIEQDIMAARHLLNSTL